jgi:hypothetical protein
MADDEGFFVGEGFDFEECFGALVKLIMALRLP